MKRQYIIIKDVVGIYHLALLWSASANKIYITNEEGFLKLSKGVAAAAIGFPREDVFKFDAAAAAAIAERKEYDWSKLKIYDVVA